MKTTSADIRSFFKNKTGYVELPIGFGYSIKCIPGSPGSLLPWGLHSLNDTFVEDYSSLNDLLEDLAKHGIIES